jgi:NodT family efflux transporter outer membrane factor (OMF) lipoprotein
MNRMRTCFPVVFAFLLLASGCMKVGPNFVKPEANVTADWLEAGHYPQISTKPDDYRDWWRSFHDPVLDSLVQKAYRQNLSLQIAGVRVLQAQAQAGVAAGQLYPQTQQLTGTVEKIRFSQNNLSSGSGTPTNFWFSTIALGASWEVDFWGKIRRGIESADAAVLASIGDYDNALVSLTGDVATNYILLRTLEKRLAIARDNVLVQKKGLKIATARWKGGTTSLRDVEQAKTVLDSTEATIPTLEAQEQQTKNILCLLMGLPPTDLSRDLGATSAIPVPPPQVALGIPHDLLRRRPDIQSAEWQAAAQCAQIGVSKADFFPAFSLTGNFGFSATQTGTTDLASLFNGISRTWAVGPAVQWNIFNYGRIMNNVRVQDAKFQALLINYKNTVLKAQQEVENALIAFLKAQQRAEKLAGAVAAAKKSVHLAFLQYSQGIADFTTVLTAEQNLLTVQDSLAVTLGDIANQLVGVYRALGGGWQLREGQNLVSAENTAEMAARTNWGKLLTPGSVPPQPLEMPKHQVRPPQW